MSAAAPLLGSLCSGIGGLDLAVERVYGTQLAWTSDPDAAAVLAARFGAPNLGDITQTDWTKVPRVHVLSCGARCQPFSLAGNGTDDPRYLWPHVTEALRHLVPDLFVMEQVPGYISLSQIVLPIATAGPTGANTPPPSAAGKRSWDEVRPTRPTNTEG